MIIQDKYLIKSIKFEQYDNMSHPKYTLNLFGNKTCVLLKTIMIVYLILIKFLLIIDFM
jgi:hypothetical protein